MFGFSIVKPPFSFTDVKTITIPTICSVNNSGLWTLTPVPSSALLYINSCFKFQRLLLKMYVEHIRNVKS